jgi:hypothetical protein
VLRGISVRYLNALSFRLGVSVGGRFRWKGAEWWMKRPVEAGQGG